MMADAVMGRFVRETIYQEIVPATELDKTMLLSFADDVVLRFQNPFIQHYLLSILLNSTSKLKARVLPSILDFQRQRGKLPVRLVFGLAALVTVYKDGKFSGGGLAARRAKGEYIMKDDLPVLKFFSAVWQSYNGTAESAENIARQILANTGLWGQDLNEIPGLTGLTAHWLQRICADGMASALTALLDETAGGN
jgi:tagaturonate reductase